MSLSASRAGVVISFDDAAGLGEIVDDAGRVFAFHCVELVDGSRSVQEGRRVRFSTRPRLGRIEAASIEAASIEAADIEARPVKASGTRSA